MPDTANPALDVLTKYRPYIKVPAHSKLLAILTLCVGVFVLIVVSVVSQIVSSNLLPYGVLSITLATIALCRRFWLQDAFTILKRDKRGLILYLRPFDSDETPETIWDMLVENFGSTGIDLVKRKYAQWISNEKKLCPILKSVGPIITFGRRNDFLNVSTACRIKVDQRYWQEVLKELMAVSSLIVIDAGKSTGLLWELRHALAEQDRKKLVIALPTGRLKAHRDGFDFIHVRSIVMDATQQSIPRIQKDLAFIRFTNEGSAVLESLSDEISFARVILGSARTTLVKVLTDLGFPTHPYRFRVFGFVRKGSFILFFLAAVLIASTSRVVQRSNDVVQRFARAEQERRKSLDDSINLFLHSNGSRTGLAKVSETVNVVLPKLKADQNELEKAAVAMSPTSKRVAEIFLRYSFLEIEALNSMSESLKKGDSTQFAMDSLKLRKADDYLTRSTAELKSTHAQSSPP